MNDALMKLVELNAGEHRRNTLPDTSVLDWNAFISGNTNALNNLHDAHVDHLFNYGCQLCGDRELVKDSIQDVFHELLRYQLKLKPVDSVKGYLLKSLRRVIIKKSKNKVPIKDRNNQEKTFQPFEIDLSYEANLILSQSEQDNRKRLQQAIEKLSEKQRQAVMLYFYEGYTYEEIADIMGMRLVKSARKLIYKSIEVIREVLQKSHTDFMLPILLGSLLQYFF